MLGTTKWYVKKFCFLLLTDCILIIFLIVLDLLVCFFYIPIRYRKQRYQHGHHNDRRRFFHQSVRWDATNIPSPTDQAVDNKQRFQLTDHMASWVVLRHQSGHCDSPFHFCMFNRWFSISWKLRIQGPGRLSSWVICERKALHKQNVQWWEFQVEIFID